MSSRERIADRTRSAIRTCRCAGWGGNASQVVLTAEDGAFSAPFAYPGSGPGNANASGDQGSSTLDVTKSAYIGNQPTAGNTQYTPNNFYAEYLTIQNTYNTTDNVTEYDVFDGQRELRRQRNAADAAGALQLGLPMQLAGAGAVDRVRPGNPQQRQPDQPAGHALCRQPKAVAGARAHPRGNTCAAGDDHGRCGLRVNLARRCALVFDHTNFFTTWHGNSATGTETIEAQNKKFATGSANDYLSGYICNSCTLLSQSSGMTNLYYGRPYGPYSTWIMLNSYVDQVNPVGWIEFQGDTNLPSSTYAEFNTRAYADPTPGSSPYPAGVFYENSERQCYGVYRDAAVCSDSDRRQHGRGRDGNEGDDVAGSGHSGEREHDQNCSHSSRSESVLARELPLRGCAHAELPWIYAELEPSECACERCKWFRPPTQGTLRRSRMAPA